MDCATQRRHQRFFCMAGTAALVSAGANAQVCNEVRSEVYSQSAAIERQIDAMRYVPFAVYRDNVHGDYVLEFTAQRTDLPNTSERWTVTFERDEAFEYVRHLEIDGVWMHTFRSRVVRGVRLVTIDAPGVSIEISRDDQPGDPKFEAFIELVTQTAEHRAAVSSVIDAFPHWDYPPLICIADCSSSEDICGNVPICDPPNNPTACDCWDAFACCMSEYLRWHLCVANCICTFCYDDFVEECCARYGAVQRVVQFECEQALLACLRSPNLLPCSQY